MTPPEIEKGKFAKKFPNGYYRPILCGKEQRSYGSADSVFSDSLLNLTLAPKSEKTGFIRIPYTGPGDYGVRLIFDKYQNRSIFFTNYYDTNQSVQDKIGRERAIESAKNNNSKHDVKKTNKAPFSDKKTRIKTIRLDRKNFGKPLGAGGKRKWPLPEED